MKTGTRLGDDPLWYKDAIFYEVRVRSFYDSDGDGTGDLRGLTEKLVYLQDLGVTTLWLLPFYPSPLKDDGYDISNYMDIHPEVGTLREFKQFLRQAHRRGLRVVTELVLNHTSDQHPWFQRARRAPAGSPERDFYVWSDTPHKFREARVIFQDYEQSNWSWDPIAKAYYWHRFYSHQPDLNYDHPGVQRAMLQVVNFWFGMGVDGLRLDAVPYLYEREGTNCENLEECHQFLRKMRKHVDEKFPNRMLLAEANQWPEDAVAYFGQGDECHMAYHFPVMPRLFMAIQMEDRFPIVDILHQTPAIPEASQWAMFLRNHDELTLEMVTDEERDYMYRVYASDPSARLNLGIRRRLSPLLGNDRKRIELMNALLLSLPGTPILYYGDEIGMGDNFYLGDRNGVRTPMQWSGDRNAGFSKANPHRLYLPVIIEPEYHYETVNVDTQQNNPHSLLWWMKRIIALRKEFQAFGKGDLEILHPKNLRVLAFLRRWQDQHVLVVANLSRFAQVAELDLGQFQGRVPIEVFGRTEFPPIGAGPYMLSIGPHSFYWFSLEPSTVPEIEAEMIEHPLYVSGEWTEVFTGEGLKALEALLPHSLPAKRWFAGKARRLKRARLLDVLSLPGTKAKLTLVETEYRDGGSEIYTLPLAFVSGVEAESLRQATPRAILGSLTTHTTSEPVAGVLYDGIFDPSFAKSLLDVIGRRRRIRGESGSATASTTGVFRRYQLADGVPDPHPFGAEQSNSSVIFGDRLVLKLFRRLESDVNPELEMGRFLTDVAGYRHTPPTLGAVEYARSYRQPPSTLALVQAFVQNSGDGWSFTVRWLDQFFEQALTRSREEEEALAELWPESLQHASSGEYPKAVIEHFGGYLDFARVLGQRTAEVHRALASSDDPRFAPEPFTKLYQRSLYQSMRNQAGRVFRILREHISQLPEVVQADADRVAALEEQLLHKFGRVLEHRIDGQRTRIHGDYHLGQVLVTGSDVHLIDFEGEPVRPISERRIKRSPLRDVAGMLRSFHYAAYAALPGYGERASARAQDLPTLESWARLWHQWASKVFFDSYLAISRSDNLIPSGSGLEILLGALTLDKAVYELGYEMNHRPSWVRIPIKTILEQLEAETAESAPIDKTKVTDEKQ